MAILSIAVCNNASKIIFARQFVEMTRKELEEYIILFRRTVSQEKEVTSFETEKNRFLYFYSDNLYLVVITTRDSNFIQDMEVLKLAYRIIIDICMVGKLSDVDIIQNAIDIALSLDDLISFGTYEGLNMLQIKNLLQMDSAEEKEFRRIQLQREKSAAEQLKAQMKEIETQRKNNHLANVNSIMSDTIQCGSNVESVKNSNDIDTSVNLGVNNNSTSGVNEKDKDESKSNKLGMRITKSKGLSLK